MIKQLRPFISLTAFVVAATGIGCAAPDADHVGSNGGADEQNAAAGYQPPKTCGDAKWNEAFTHYKHAVDLSKVRIANDASCHGDWYLASIVSEAHAAADACSDFSTIIAKSPWAEPLRTVMRDTLDLDVVTKRVSTADWSGLEAALADDVTFYDTDGGVLGNAGWITLGTGVATAVVTTRVWTDDGVRELEKVGSYRIGKRLPDGSIEIILTVNASGGPEEVLVFTLTRDLQLKGGGRTYFTTPSECEA